MPENTYRELKQGEEYKPAMPAGSLFPEATLWTAGMGILVVLIFSVN
ncbi:MAG: hypothetical protein V1904_00730 [Bacteroidota bacterium]